MNFIDVKWHHAESAEPVRLVSELDSERNETRKLEFFSDGRVGFASENASSQGTALGLMPVPPLEEINEQSEFEGVAMSASTFEQLWRTFGPQAAQQGIQADAASPRRLT